MQELQTRAPRIQEPGVREPGIREPGIRELRRCFRTCNNAISPLQSGRDDTVQPVGNAASRVWESPSHSSCTGATEFACGDLQPSEPGRRTRTSPRQPAHGNRQPATGDDLVIPCSMRRPEGHGGTTLALIQSESGVSRACAIVKVAQTVEPPGAPPLPPHHTCSCAQFPRCRSCWVRLAKF